jgi:hypothetical protein
MLFTTENSGKCQRLNVEKQRNDVKKLGLALDNTMQKGVLSYCFSAFLLRFGSSCGKTTSYIFFHPQSGYLKNSQR